MKETKYVDSAIVYGKSYGMIYYCAPCQAWVGVHHGHSRKALGRVANAELREWKKKAHAAFDALWQRKINKEVRNGAKRHGRGYMNTRSRCRNAAYQWLSEALNIPKKQAHIGMFDVEQCRRVVEVCTPYLSALRVGEPQYERALSYTAKARAVSASGIGAAIEDGSEQSEDGTRAKPDGERSEAGTHNTLPNPK